MQTARKAWTVQADKTLSEAGLTLSTAACFYSISRVGEGSRQVALAEDMGIKAPTLVRQLDILEDCGLITRRDEAADRRTRLVYLAKAGKTLASKIDTMIVELTREMMHGIPASDIEIAKKVFARVVANAENLSTAKGK
jgi:MarR family transcriptional regulator for hemolysin